jgi:uncharacterized protein YoxC
MGKVASVSKMSLNIMCYQCIKDSFYYGIFGDFKIVIDKDTGYFNATKLCEQGGKDYDTWSCLDKTKDMISYYYENRVGEMYIGYVIEGSDKDKLIRQITGTYIPKELILDIISWISYDFYDKCANIIIDHFVSEFKNMNDISFKNKVEMLEEQMEVLTLEKESIKLQKNESLKDIVNRIDQSNKTMEKYIRSLGASLAYIIDQGEKLMIKTTNLEKQFKINSN